jgi:predicted dehydrogenase
MPGGEKYMKVLVVGCGSIGARHIRNLRAIGIEDVLATDPSTARLHEVTAENQCRPVETLSAGLAEKPQAVFICTPPNLHVPQAMDAVKAGAHCFIEKPISDSEKSLDDLLSLATSQQRKILVGYVLRFEPVFAEAQRLLSQNAIGRIFYVRAELGTYLPDWRPGQDYRKSYTSHRSMGGGVLLDTSHELDLVRAMMGRTRSVFCAAGTLGGIGIEAEDTAEVTIWFESGTLCSVHLDIVQQSRTRYCKLVGTEGSIVIDFNEGVVKHFLPQKKEWTIIPCARDNNQPYIDEIRHFFDCIRNNTQPRITGRDGKAALQIALAARQSSESGAVVPLSA